MATSSHHSDTDSRPAGLDARVRQALDWVGEHRREFLLGLGAALVLGIGVAIASEISSSRREEALAELAGIEADFAAQMGAPPDAALIPEPANPEQARSAREAALSRFDAFAQAHASSDLAANAQLRGAELEVDLGRLDAAATRLEKLAADLDDGDTRKGIALRLRGAVLEDLGRAAEAAEIYETGGKLESYPARALLWLAAARTHMRLGADERALHALEQVVAAEPELASDPSLERERKILEARLSLAAAPTPEAEPPAAPPP
jgi:tetratricopeptide (TPR) repeat protein